ncbi:D-aminoacid aminotransferase-like PLP-dependent enzyme [Aspergillus pseudoustus]|uniref:D-aminoacid aminotransferase-like PLP-dependent enzyme n=1 Tax=Aspergillus pseudoustus TaxID=1810923 RepID=A0ABR4IFF3_9EURO
MATMQMVSDAYQARQTVLAASKNPFAQGVAWVEGKLAPLHEARIPLLDQGLMHSDLTYDVPSVWDGRFFRLDDHITRLEASCVKLRLKLPLPHEEVKSILVDMVAKSGIRDAFVEIIVTRGLKGVRGTDPKSIINSLYMFIQPYVWVMEPEMQPTGGSAIIARTVRRTPPGSMDPTIKSLQWGDLVRGLHEASDRGAMYPFLTVSDTNLTEGSGFNIILVKDNILYTPSRGVLEGITRKSVIDAAQINGYEIRVALVPDGMVGPVTKKIWDTYWAMHYDEAFSFEISYEGKEARL